MPFVVPGVCRFTVHGTYAGRNVANILDYKIDTTGSTEGRGDACNGMAGIVLQEWNDSILPLTNSAYIFQSVSWVDLDSADGVIGSRSASGSVTLPKAGLALNTPMPGSVCYLVRKNVAARRGARKGRMYLAGVDETSTLSPSANIVQSTQVTAWQTRMNSFLGDTNQDSVSVFGYDSKLSVVHILTREDPPGAPGTGKPLTGEAMQVTSLTFDNLLATQRRRLRG